MTTNTPTRGPDVAVDAVTAPAKPKVDPRRAVETQPQPPRPTPTTPANVKTTTQTMARCPSCRVEKSPGNFPTLRDLGARPCRVCADVAYIRDHTPERFLRARAILVYRLIAKRKGGISWEHLRPVVSRESGDAEFGLDPRNHIPTEEAVAALIDLHLIVDDNGMLRTITNAYLLSP